MKRMLIVLAVLALAGCATHNLWVKPKTTQAQFDTDMAACKYDADKAAAPTLAQNGFINGYQVVTLTQECMQSKGYRWESMRAAQAERAAYEASHPKQ
jgi:uncharacterized protein YceK